MDDMFEIQKFLPLKSSQLEQLLRMLDFLFCFFLNLDCFYFYHVCITIYLTSIVNFTGLSDYHGFHVGIEVKFEH